MYTAKAAGKGRYAALRADDARRVLERLELRPTCGARSSSDEFVLHYQPIVDLATGEIVGVEALVRWQHPERGLVPPTQFIPLAEETGLIVPLGHWVLERGVPQAALWQAQLARRAAADDDRQPLGQAAPGRPTSSTDVAAILRDTGLNPRACVLEITESVMMPTSTCRSPRLKD